MGVRSNDRKDKHPWISDMARRALFLVYPGFVLFELSGPAEALLYATEFSGGAGGYEIHVVSPEGGLVRASSGVEVMTTRIADEPAPDTLFVVGGVGPLRGEYVQEVIEGVRRLAPEARRTASVCTGAFLLAAAGRLDGRTVTTHWSYAPRLQERFPGLKVDGDRIYTREGGVWTSAGMSAGVDMTLAMIEEDLGREVAQSVARMLVVYYRRPGGQHQYSSLVELSAGSERIDRALAFARERLAEPLNVERLAKAASLSPRQFSRAFHAATGMTPAKALERLRVEAARPMVEDGRRTFDEIARLAGFGDPERMRQSFVRTLGHTPLELRRLARGGAGGGAG